MQHFVVGLGNPGEEYDGTRHNVGALVVELLREAMQFPEWKIYKKHNALLSIGKIGKEKVTLLLPQGFMNKSGVSVKPFVLNAKQAERVVVIYDDLDLPLGSVRISFDRSSGGHKGLESVIRALKTRKFARVRVGICPTTPLGKTKKPRGEQAVTDFILGSFQKTEQSVFRNAAKRAAEAARAIVEQGRERATSTLVLTQ